MRREAETERKRKKENLLLDLLDSQGVVRLLRDARGDPIGWRSMSATNMLLVLLLGVNWRTV